MFLRRNAERTKDNRKGMTMSLKVALIGCGYWGPNLLRNFYDHGLTVPLLADLSEARRKWVAARYPATKPVSSWEDVVSDGRIDAVAIATPPQTHYDIARAAIEQGKHVLVEKPMALRSEDCESLTALAKKRGVLLMVDHVYVYKNAVQNMRKLVDVGEMGHIRYYDSVRVNLGLFQSHVNVLWDLGPHDLSIVDYLLGGLEIDKIWASGSKMKGVEHEYQVYLDIKTVNGVTVHLHLNWLSPVKIRQVMVAGEHLMAVFDENEPAEQLKIYDKGFDPGSDEKKYELLGTYRKGSMNAPYLAGREALTGVVTDFVQSIETGKKPLASAEQGTRVVRVLEQAQKLLEEQ